jgi:hypothetical protein
LYPISYPGCAIYILYKNLNYIKDWLNTILVWWRKQK